MVSQLWPMAIVSSALLANAFPTDSLLPRDGVTEPILLCDDTVNGLKLRTNTPPWMTDAQPWGDAFCISHWDRGLRITGMHVWKESNNGDCSGKGAINRLEVTYASGNMVAIGNKGKDCDAGYFALDSDEYFIDSVITNVAGDHPNTIGKISMKTNKQTIYLKDESNPGATDYVQPTGVGQLFAITGNIRSDGVISSMDFQFVTQNIQKQTRLNMVFSDDDLKQVPINYEAVAVGNFTTANGDHINTQSVTTQVTHSSSSSSTTENTWTQSFNVDAKLSGGKPGMEASVEAKYEWSHTTDTTDSTTSSSGQQVTFSYTCEVGPGEVCVVTGSYGTASLDSVGWTADGRYIFEDGTDWHFKEHGWFSGDVSLIENNAKGVYYNATTGAELRVGA